jgi:hypothetical protein
MSSSPKAFLPAEIASVFLPDSYRTTEGTKLWVITECDRSATTILLPEEY